MERLESRRTAGLFPDMLQALIDDCKHMGVQQGIINGFSVPAVFDQAALFQDAELMGNGALGHAQFRCNVINAFFFVHQGVHDLKPGGGSEYFKQFCKLFKFVLINESSFFFLNNMIKTFNKKIT